MKYSLFLLDLDDTLLDFGASERQSFWATLDHFSIAGDRDTHFTRYQNENRALWKAFEDGLTTKEHLKVERFRRSFDGVDALAMSTHYLEMLPKTVVLIEHAVEFCQWLSSHGEIGILTNGIQSVQGPRIRNSPLAPYISFISVSEESGFAKPDVRFFEHSVQRARHFEKPSTLMIGDRFDTDIVGAHAFGIDSCWYNPRGDKPTDGGRAPTYEIRHLSELKKILD